MQTTCGVAGHRCACMQPVTTCTSGSLISGVSPSSTLPPKKPLQRCATPSRCCQKKHSFTCAQHASGMRVHEYISCMLVVWFWSSRFFGHQKHPSCIVICIPLPNTGRRCWGFHTRPSASGMAPMRDVAHPSAHPLQQPVACPAPQYALQLPAACSHPSCASSHAPPPLVHAVH